MHTPRIRIAVLAGILSLAAALPASAQTLLDGEREAQVTAIPGVVAEGAQWSLTWADFVTADGILCTPDGGVMFAQEQTDKIIKLALDGKQYTVVEDANAPGSVSLANEGRLFAVQRTCT